MAPELNIITTDPNTIAAQVHDHMPVILHPRDYERWLERGHVAQLPIDLLRLYGAEEMNMAKVNSKVGNVRNNGPEMLEGPDDEAEPLSVLNSK